MPNQSLTEENLVEEIKLVLGGSSIEVELTDKDILLAARRTLRVYNRFLPFQGRAKLAVTATQKKYRLDNLHADLIGLVDVDFITDQIAPSTVDPFDPYYASPMLGLGSADQTFGDITQQRMYSEDVSRVVGSEPEWHGQWERVLVSTGPDVYEQQFFAYVDIVRSTVQCSYTYNSRYADTDDPSTGRLAIPDGDTQWFLDYTTALCKQVLARVTGKHGGVVGPDGQTDQTDASDLRQEAKDDLERLEADIKLRRRPGLPLTE